MLPKHNHKIPFFHPFFIRQNFVLNNQQKNKNFIPKFLHIASTHYT